MRFKTTECRKSKEMSRYFFERHGARVVELNALSRVEGAASVVSMAIGAPAEGEEDEKEGKEEEEEEEGEEEEQQEKVESQREKERKRDKKKSDNDPPEIQPEEQGKEERNKENTPGNRGAPGKCSSKNALEYKGDGGGEIGVSQPHKEKEMNDPPKTSVGKGGKSRKGGKERNVA